MFMTAAHPSVRSIPISVTSFEYSMNLASPRNRVSEADAGPILSYVREDDTHATLVTRLMGVVGEHTNTDWGRLRMAVVDEGQVPHFIPRGQAGGTGGGGAAAAAAGGREKEQEREESYSVGEGVVSMDVEHQEQEQEQQGGETLVWSLFDESYPNYTRAHLVPPAHAALPLLGLQHPTAEQRGDRGGVFVSTRGVRKVSSGIKIN
jgi:hypothetical protein